MNGIHDGVRYLRPRFTRALILENPDPSLDAYLEAQGIATDRLPESATLDEDEVVRVLREGQHDLIFKRSRFEINDRVLLASEHLAAIMLCCIGDDSVDKEACARHGVLVMNDPVSNARSVVELVFGEMLSLARRTFETADKTARHIWTKDSRQRYEIKGKTLGIIGLGNIGKQVAQMGEMFGMKVLFYDNRELAREVGTTLGWTACKSMAEVFRQSDVVTLHLSAEDSRGISNRDSIDRDLLLQLAAERGPNSPRIFLNAARGFLYDPEDLKFAISQGAIRHAAVDVFPDEPGSASDKWVNPYSEFPQIVCTPHIGAATQEAQPRIAQYVANTTQLFHAMGAVRDCVYSPGQGIGVNLDGAGYILTVVHSDARGTKKAVDDAIFEAGRNNLLSSHRDFPKYGFAYDVNAIDRPLTREQLERLVASARAISGDPSAIRAVRQVAVERG